MEIKDITVLLLTLRNKYMRGNEEKSDFLFFFCNLNKYFFEWTYLNPPQLHEKTEDSTI